MWNSVQVLFFIRLDCCWCIAYVINIVYGDFVIEDWICCSARFLRSKHFSSHTLNCKFTHFDAHRIGGDCGGQRTFLCKTTFWRFVLLIETKNSPRKNKMNQFWWHNVRVINPYSVVLIWSYIPCVGIVSLFISLKSIVIPVVDVADVAVKQSRASQTSFNHFFSMIRTAFFVLISEQTISI